VNVTTRKHSLFVSDALQSLVKFLAEAHRGVHGFVMDEHGNPVEKASLKVKGRDVGFQTTKYGEFWRILLPGVYKLEVCTIILVRVRTILTLVRKWRAKPTETVHTYKHRSDAFSVDFSIHREIVNLQHALLFFFSLSLRRPYGYVTSVEHVTLVECISYGLRFIQ